MLVWVIPAMWALTRILAYIFQLIGLLGLLGFGLIGLNAITDRILEEGADTE